MPNRVWKKSELNRSKYEKVFTVNVFSKSEELALFKRLVESNRYDDSSLIHKMFFRYNDKDNLYYLKNKYLYLTTQGIISYFKLRKKNSQYDKEEVELICEMLKKQNFSHVISLGAADSQKEKTIFEKLKEEGACDKKTYIPIDVSPMLIQLGINNFTTDEKFKDITINSIVADFWHLAEYIRNLKDDEKKKEKRNELFGNLKTGKRLFLILGETFGNYDESDLLNQVLELMDDDDTLVISVAISGKQIDEPTYRDFLFAPLSYVPFFYGYTKYPERFLKKKYKMSYKSKHYSKKIFYFVENCIIKNKKEYNLVQTTYYYNKKKLKEKLLNSGKIIDRGNCRLIVAKKKQYKNEGQSNYKPNSTSLNQVVFNKSFNVSLFSDSEELSFLGSTSPEYYDEKVLKKLFNFFQEGKNDNIYSDYYLKNKYLYITTMGIMNYLRLYEAQKNTLADFFSFEKSELKEIILDILNENDDLNLISLGAAISDKEAEVLREIFEDNETYRKKIKYSPVDISPMLIQLGINNFSKDRIFENFEVNSLVADFWSIASCIKYKKFQKDEDNKNEIPEDNKKEIRKRFWNQNDQKRLFIILGGTFGNYTEKEFLDQVLELMDENDELMISVKLQQSNREYSPDKDYANLPGNEGFLLEPLTYIPLYYGYSRHYWNYLVTNDKANLSEGDDEIKFVSVVPKSKCTAPYVEVENIGEKSKRGKIRMCWSTRYDSEELKKWMVETYYMGEEGKEIYKLEYCKDGKGNDWYHRQQQDNCYAVMRLKKVKVSYLERIKHYLDDVSLEDDQKINNIINQLHQNRLLDCNFYNELKKRNNKNIRNFIKEYAKKNHIK